MWLQMIIDEDPADITKMNMTFVGYARDYKKAPYDPITINFSIWAFNNANGSSGNWEQIGAAQSINGSNGDGSFTRSITSNFTNYIDSANLSLMDWGVYIGERSLMEINYVELVVSTNTTNTSYNYTSVRSACYADIRIMPLGPDEGKGDIMATYNGITSGNISYKKTAADWNYQKAAVSENIWWPSTAPSGSDMTFMWQQMQVHENPADVSKIEFLYEGAGVGINGTFEMWVWNNANGSSGNWEQIGTMNIVDGVEIIMNRNVSSNCSNYIDTGNLSIVDWGVWYTTSNLGTSRYMNTDYVAMNVTTSVSRTIFRDSFEVDFSKWTDGGATNWLRDTTQAYNGSYSAHAADGNEGALTSDNIDLSDAISATLDFWYMDDDADAGGDFELYFYDGATYNLIADLAGGTEDVWQHWDNVSINLSTYRISNFRIMYSASPDFLAEENMWVDEVKLNKTM